MGLFDFLNPKKKQNPITIFSKNLSINEKVAITSAMYLIVNLHGTRQIHAAEIKFIEGICRNILDLNQKDLLATDTENFDIEGILKAMSESQKEYFAGVFYGLSNIMQDQPVIKMASVIVSRM
jgi:hypothetical protein